MLVTIAYFATVLLAVGVFVFGLTFRGRVAALIGMQASLALHVVLVRWESAHEWAEWMFWPAAQTATWFDPPDPGLSWLEKIAYAIATAVTAFLIGFVANSIVLGVLLGLVYDAVRRIRRVALPGKNSPEVTPFPDESPPAIERTGAGPSDREPAS